MVGVKVRVRMKEPGARRQCLSMKESWAESMTLWARYTTTPVTRGQGSLSMRRSTTRILLVTKSTPPSRYTTWPRGTGAGA